SSSAAARSAVPSGPRREDRPCSPCPGPPGTAARAAAAGDGTVSLGAVEHRRLAARPPGDRLIAVEADLAVDQFRLGRRQSSVSPHLHHAAERADGSVMSGPARLARPDTPDLEILRAADRDRSRIRVYVGDVPRPAVGGGTLKAQP